MGAKTLLGTGGGRVAAVERLPWQLTVPASVLQPSNRLTPGPARVMQIRISEYSVELPRNIPLRLGGIPSKN